MVITMTINLNLTKISLLLFYRKMMNLACILSNNRIEY